MKKLFRFIKNNLGKLFDFFLLAFIMNNYSAIAEWFSLFLAHIT